MNLNEADLYNLHNKAGAGGRAVEKLTKQVADLNIMLKATRDTLRDTRKYVQKLEKRIAKLEAPIAFWRSVKAK